MSADPAIASACRLGISLQAARARLADHVDKMVNPPRVGDLAATYRPIPLVPGAVVPPGPSTAKLPTEPAAGSGDAPRPNAGTSLRVCADSAGGGHVPSPVLSAPAPDPHEPRGCRWIDGDPKRGPWRYCQRPEQDGSAYCAHHHARSVTRTMPLKLGEAAE